jgi:transcriptional regulator with XRE-family HTH domain
MKRLKAWLDSDPSRTQLGIARRCQVSPPTVNGWVHGKSGPEAAQLPTLSELTGLPLEDLVADIAEDARERKAARNAA